ncbi:X-linked retinitis pigmentosa GTPase regulator-interacting protein 1 [Triplophysa tibetana]|uniref:X-linked retinitis pigmentosa GTPase regulator-interacting protein 1 n=1 Tax=Triplophysa tibetana TaxID=1572043 RepID=A0A5A9N5K1_9TELE|nr:X-linked retinitis pigmentosa GTPase regulator-interacting protein 1 [Triplophysa tibetana]
MMSLTAVDETAGDLPVRDLEWRGLIPVPQDRQRLFKVPREQLEDQCLRLKEENTLLKQHSRTQEQKLRRLSTKLLRLKQGPEAVSRDGELEDTIQELEARVATLESQKGMLQSKLNLAKQHILDLGVRSHNRPRTGVMRAAQTAPARCGFSSMDEARGEIDRFRSAITETQQERVAEQEFTSLRETLRHKEKEIESVLKDLRRQQADGYRLTIKDNVDVIKLQKQLSEKSATILVIQEKFTVLQEAYENQLEEEQKSLKESQGALLGKVEEFSEELKQEKQRVLTLEEQLNNATLSLQALRELQERVLDLEDERNLLKKSYDSLLESTMPSQSHQQPHEDEDRKRETMKEDRWRDEVQRLEERLQEETKERRILEKEIEKLKQENEEVQKEKEWNRDKVMSFRDKHDCLEREVLQHRHKVTTLQEKLDSVTKEFDMSVEDLSETLLQIKAFRMKQETQAVMHFLKSERRFEDSSEDLTALQASYAETVLELQKTRDLLLLQHRLNADLQKEMKTVIESHERESEENKRKAGEKDKVLKSRALQITNLQVQLKELAYSPTNYKRTTLPQTIPLQYTWTGLELHSVQPTEDDTMYRHVHEGESLLEIHFTGATFTPLGLRLMGQDTGDQHGVVTFCTYGFLDFESLSTPLICGEQPNYGFTSHYALAAFDVEKLRVQGAFISAELHQGLGGEIFDYGGGIPNELEVVLERCVGLRTHWPGLLPDAFLTYRLYDLPPHSTDIIQSCADPVFNDSVRYPLAATMDLLEYLNAGSLWVYVLDESERQTPPVYLAKTPIPLRALATGRPIRGDFVLRDPAGNPRGMLRASLRWKYPFYAPESSLKQREREEPKTKIAEISQTPTTKSIPPSAHRPKTARPHPSVSKRASERVSVTSSQSPAPKRIPPIQRSYPSKPSSTSPQASRSVRGGKHHTAPLLIQGKASIKTAHLTPPMSIKSHESDRVVDFRPSTSEPSSPQSQKSDHSESREQGDILRVEILSLSFNPTSNVALNQSVNQVYVEYRLLGVPMETTETPMSLRKPTEGEEIHYNFMRVIHVDCIDAAPLRHYLYTILEGTDPNQGRLKFTVVSEPTDEQDECEDVGFAYLDLRQLLLTGNDVIEQQINVVSVNEEQEVVGKLKVSVEAAQALNGIYHEYHQIEKSDCRAQTNSTEDEEQMKRNNEMQVLEIDEHDSDC